MVIEFMFATSTGPAPLVTLYGSFPVPVATVALPLVAEAIPLMVKADVILKVMV
ncbi:hypothetical protein D3C73_1180170 [compost metagenome]